MAEVIVYSSDHCPFCIRAKELLRRKQVDYTEIRIDLDEEQRDKMIALSGRRTVPQIFIDGKSVGGFDDIWALEQQGKLDSLLK